MELEQKRHTQQEPEAGKPNLTGIPLQMKESFERSSGLSFDDVRVHYHSTLPARLGALAYTKGTHIYVASGQEQHLGHELGHVIQQKQGRVRATLELNGVKLNTSPAMEQEADALCRQAEQGTAQTIQRRQTPPSEVVQMKHYSNIAEMWAGICGHGGAVGMIQQIVDRDPVLAELYRDAAQQVPNCNFQQIPNCDFQGRQGNIRISLDPDGAGHLYRVDYTAFPTDQYYFIASIIHELAHAAARTQYHRNLTDSQSDENASWLNMNLPSANGAGAITPRQEHSRNVQEDLLLRNVRYLRNVVENDRDLYTRSRPAYQHLTKIGGRLDYMEVTLPEVHYDTVLGDMMFYLQFNQLQDTPSYRLMQRMLREANDRRHQRRWFGNNESPYVFSERPAWLSRY